MAGAPSASASIFEIPISASLSSGATSGSTNGPFNTGGVNFGLQIEPVFIAAAIALAAVLLLKKGR